MATSTFTCAGCGRELAEDNSEEERLAELRENFPEHRPGAPLEKVCDECYRSVLTRRTSGAGRKL